MKSAKTITIELDPTERAVIEKLNEYLADEDAWTTGALARDKDGEALRNPYDPKATCRCALGWGLIAYRDVTGETFDTNTGMGPVADLLNGLAKAIEDEDDITALNDNAGYDVVIRVITTALDGGGTL